MPTYEYVCDACHHAFDEWQSFAADKLTKCPKCKKAKLRRLFGSGAAIVFKGSGFYETDYRRTDADKSAEKADKEAATAKPETKADTKTEATPKADTPAPAAEPVAPKTTAKGKKTEKS